MRPSVVLPLPDSPTRPSTSPRRMSSETPSTALTIAGLASDEPVGEAAADRVVGLAGRGSRRAGLVRLHRRPRSPRARAVAAAGTGSGRLGPCSQQNTRRPSASRCSTGSSSAQTCIASGQRGWKRQPGGGSIRFGGAPGIECSAVVSSEIVERSSSRVYGCAGLRRRPPSPGPPRRSGRRTSRPSGRTPRRRSRGCA